MAKVHDWHFYSLAILNVLCVGSTDSLTSSIAGTLRTVGLVFGIGIPVLSGVAFLCWICVWLCRCLCPETETVVGRQAAPSKEVCT